MKKKYFRVVSDDDLIVRVAAPGKLMVKRTRHISAVLARL